VSGVPPACDELSRVEADRWPQASSQIEKETILDLKGYDRLWERFSTAIYFLDALKPKLS